MSVVSYIVDVSSTFLVLYITNVCCIVHFLPVFVCKIIVIFATPMILINWNFLWIPVAVTKCLFCPPLRKPIIITGSPFWLILTFYIYTTLATFVIHKCSQYVLSFNMSLHLLRMICMSDRPSIFSSSFNILLNLFSMPCMFASINFLLIFFIDRYIPMSHTLQGNSISYLLL